MNYLELLEGIVNFSNEIKSENRFHLENSGVITNIYEYFKNNNLITLKKGEIVYRARVDFNSQNNLTNQWGQSNGFQKSLTLTPLICIPHAGLRTGYKCLDVRLTEK